MRTETIAYARARTELRALRSGGSRSASLLFPPATAAIEPAPGRRSIVNPPSRLPFASNGDLQCVRGCSQSHHSRSCIVRRVRAAGVGGGKAHARAAHRCHTDLAAKHTNGRTMCRADRLQRSRIRRLFAACVRKHGSSAWFFLSTKLPPSHTRESHFVLSQPLRGLRG